MQISSTGTSRRPSGPTTVTIAPAAIIAGTLSAAGEALHMLPTIVARPWIWVEPISSTASTTPGHSFSTSGCSPSCAPLTAAPIRKPPSSAAIVAHARDVLDVDHEVGLDQAGAELHQKIGAARQHARHARSAGEQRLAASSDCGASYCIVFDFLPRRSHCGPGHRYLAFSLARRRLHVSRANGAPRDRRSLVYVG